MNLPKTLLLSFLFILGCGKTVVQKALDSKTEEPTVVMADCTCDVQLESIGIGKKNPLIEEGLICDSIDFFVDKDDQIAMEKLGFTCGKVTEAQQISCSRRAHKLDCQGVEESCIAAKSYAKKPGTCKLFGG